jgi:Bacteriophage baseplate protein W
MADRPLPFLGRGWAFPPALVGSGGEAQLVADEADIRQSLNILLRTFPGERVMRPEFGLDPGLFGLASETSISDLKARIATAITRFEPRVRVVALRETHVTPEGRIDIGIDYEIPAVNARGNLVYPFYLPASAGAAGEGRG